MRKTTKETGRRCKKKASSLEQSKFVRKKITKRKKKTNTMKIQSNICDSDEEKQLFEQYFMKWMNDYQVCCKFKQIMTIMNVPENATDKW